jgi:anti-anti-sigma factor
MSREAELTVGGHERPAPPSGGPAVVVLPAELDYSNADQAGRELAAALASGASVVIADLTATTFCDSPGARMLWLAHNRAVEKRVGLRLVVTSAAVRRVLEIMELDDLLRIYPTLDAALAAARLAGRR